MIKLSTLKRNPKNPRQITSHKLELLKKSIQQFERMMELRPIVVDENGVALGGNMRLEALKAIGYKEIPESWVKRAEDLTDEQKREFVIKDNSGFGEWDWDALTTGDWQDAPLEEWGVNVPQDWSQIERVNTTNDWVGMPEFEPGENPLTIVVKFESEADRGTFAEQHKLKFTQQKPNTWTTWWPFKERERRDTVKYEQE